MTGLILFGTMILTVVYKITDTYIMPAISYFIKDWQVKNKKEVQKKWWIEKRWWMKLLKEKVFIMNGLSAFVILRKSFSEQKEMKKN